MALFNDVPVAFPWYDKIEKQNRYKLHADGVCDYKLNSPYDAMLPFQFRREMSTFIPLKWEILNINTDEVIADISPSLGLIRAKSRNTYDYFYYAGEALTTTGGALSLDPGMFYYSRLTMYNGQQFFSEMFFVPEILFSVSGSESTNLLKFEWWNDNDLPPIFYNDKVLGVPIFKNIVYLDTFIHVSEPEITEDTTEDGMGNEIPTFQRAMIRYRVTDLVPDFLKVAIVLMQIHDHVVLTTPGNIYSGEIERIETTSGAEANGFLSNIDIIFEEDVAIIKKACNDNMPLPVYVIPDEPVLYSVLIVGSVARVNALIVSEMWGVLYGSTTMGGVYVPVSGPLQQSELLAGTATVPGSNVLAYNFFKLSAENFNTSGFFSNTVPKT